MSRRNDRGALLDMRHYGRLAVQQFEAVSADDLHGNVTLHFALRYLVLIVGEAANRVSPEGQARHPEIPWSDVIGMRHVLTHGYDEVKRDRLHETVAVHLPKLLRQLDAILGEP